MDRDRADEALAKKQREARERAELVAKLNAEAVPLMRALLAQLVAENSYATSEQQANMFAAARLLRQLTELGA